jgi:hypothetical protein
MRTQDIEAAAAEWGNTPTEPSTTDAVSVAPDAVSDPVASLPDGNATPDTLAAAPASAPAAPSTPEATVQMIEALLGDQTQSLRADLMIPLTIDGQRQLVPLSELQRGGMREADYTRKTQAIADARRQVAQQERELKIAAATVAKQNELMAQERERMMLTQNDPEEYQRYLNHVSLLQSDAQYREVWETAQRAKLRDVEDEVIATIDREEMQASIVDDIADTAQQFAAMTEFAGVQAADAIALYTNRLSSGQAELNTQSLRRAFADLAQQRATLIDPLRREMDDLKKTIAELSAARDADAINSTVRGQVPTRRTPAVVPTRQPNASAPVAPSDTGRPRRRTMSLEEAAEAWSRS